LDESPDVAEQIDNKKWAPERQPLPAELALRAWFNNLVQPFKMARVLSEVGPGSRITKALSVGGLGGAPKTRFNRKVSPHRVIDGVAFDLKTLSDIKEVVTGATVNDVVIALIGGALRKYLHAKSEVPGETMLAVAPVTVETRNNKTQVVDMRVPLSTHIDDALERLEAVRDAIQASGTADRAVRAQLLTDFNEHAPAMTAALASRLYANMGSDLLSWITPPFNATITNVPGPQVPLYLAGARMVTKHGLGALTDGAGLNFTALSYCGELTITLTTCRAMVKDPAYFAVCLEESFEDLVRASADRRSRRKKVA
ncbi:MAG: WS/DGAT domain-containing protein, partial [Alphaproteobacteria bacterium]